MVLTAASARGADTLIGSVFGTRFPGEQSAYGGSLALQHSFGQNGMVVGVSDTEYPIGSLSEIDFDAYRVESARFALTGGVSLGEANADPVRNVLYKARLSVDSQIDPMWLVHAGFQYIDLNFIHGNLVAASVECKPDTVWGVKVGGGYDLTGTVSDRYGSVEANWYAKWRIFGGIVLGRTGYDPAALGEVSVVERLFQVYTGASVPLAKGTLNLGFDTLSLERSSRQTLRIGFSQPIKP